MSWLTRTLALLWGLDPAFGMAARSEPDADVSLWQESLPHDHSDSFTFKAEDWGHAGRPWEDSVQDWAVDPPQFTSSGDFFFI